MKFVYIPSLSTPAVKSPLNSQEVFLFIAVTFSIASGHSVFIKFSPVAETFTTTLSVKFSSALLLTVIVALPTPTAVITPVSDTVATSTSEVSYKTDLSAASSGNTVVCKVYVSYNLRATCSILSVTEVGGTTGFSLVTSTILGYNNT